MFGGRKRKTSDGGEAQLKNIKPSPCNRPNVFFDITIGGERVGRVIMELYDNAVPKTTENFRKLCRGDVGESSTGMKRCFKGTIFSRILPDWEIMGGNFNLKTRFPPESATGGKFANEGFTIKHGERGILSMENFDAADNNSSIFLILLKEQPTYDGRKVAFGKIVGGLDVLQKIESVGSPNGVPAVEVMIADSGEI